MDKFVLDGQYGKLLGAYGIKLEEVLRKAEVPEDIFCRKTPVMSAAEYYRFMDTLGKSAADPETPIRIATAENIEVFSPPIFAAYCSKDGFTCIERLGRYKKLIGPMEYRALQDGNELTVEISTGDPNIEMPQFLAETEMVFLVHILRSATKEAVAPLRVVMQNPVQERAFEQFMTVNAEAGDKNLLVFSCDALSLPFISQNDSLWSYFEPELNKRLSELDVDDSFAARVRSALSELLPGGSCGIDDAARKLGVSRRTLQRKLGDEQTSFQKQLNSTRELLAKHYILNTDMTSNDIAYLLGYQELNSFLRAFNIWTGMSISEYKKAY